MSTYAEGAVFHPIGDLDYVADGRIDDLIAALAADRRGRIVLVRKPGWRRPTYRVLSTSDQIELGTMTDNQRQLRKRLRRSPTAVVGHIQSNHDLTRVTTMLDHGAPAVVVLRADAVIGVIVRGDEQRSSGKKLSTRRRPPPEAPRYESALGAPPASMSGPPPASRPPIQPPARPPARRSGVPAAGSRGSPGSNEGTNPGGKPNAIGEPVVRRTPHLGAPINLPTAPGSSFIVKVRLDETAMAEEEDGADVVIAAPESVRTVTVQVELLTSPHLRVVGEHQGNLVIDRSQSVSKDVVFTLEVLPDAPARPVGVLALFKYRGRPCGFVSKAWDFSPAAAEATPLPGHAFAATGVPVHVESVRPDVTVTVTAPVADGQHFVCSVESPVVRGYAVPRAREFGLPTTAQRFVANQIEGLIDGKLTAGQRRRNLATVGYRFWKAAPPNFQELIWEIFDSGAEVKNLYIATAEPTLPWELMIPHRMVGGLLEEKRPLGVEFAIGRWTRGDAASPPQRLPVRNTFVIAPTYAPSRALTKAADEVQFLKQHLRGTQVPSATIDDLDSYFNNNSASLLHFVCHGAAALADDGTVGGSDDSAIYLDDDEELRSDTLLALGGFKALCRRRAPMVFLNACEAGITVAALVGSAGFPAAFSDIGARAILAPLWPVVDTLAHDFALDVYNRGIAPGAPPLAEIVRSVREAAYEHDNADTFAAYAFYGDPLATLQLVDG